MTRTFVQQDTQIYNSNVYDDTITPSLANFETNPTNLETDLNNIRSQLSNLIDVQVGDWYTDLIVPSALETGAQRGVNDLNTALHAVEKKRVLRNVYSLVDITTVASAFATGTLTGTANFADTETVTIDTKTYTFQTTLTNVDGNIQIGASLADSLQNLYDAINLTGTPGTQYAAATTLHTTVSATTVTATTVVVTAKKAGTYANSFATTETAANASWGAATLTGGAGDVVILGTGELPSQTTAAVGAVTTLGTVVASHTGTFGTFSFDEVTGANAINPKNLMVIVHGDTRDPILSGNRIIYGLLQGESGLTDGGTITDTTTTRVQISFVRINAEGNDLESIDAADLNGVQINYATRERVRLEDLNEADFLNGAVVDVPSGSTVTLQTAHDGQGATPVNVTTNITIDLEGAGLQYCWRDDLEADLFCIIEGSAGGTSEVEVAAATDLFNVDAVVNDFLNGASFDTGAAGTTINVGVTANQIDSGGELTVASGGGTDLNFVAALELNMTDSYRAGSTWSLVDGIALANSSAEWSAFETQFGEVSLLAAITAASNSTVHNRVQAVLTANVPADTDVSGPANDNNLDVNLGDLSAGTFVDDYDIYVNGILQRNGANAGANEDVYPGTSLANGQLKFEYDLKGVGNVDVITVIKWV